MGLYAYRRVAGGGGATIEAPDRASAVRELVRRGETPATLEEVGAQVGSRGAGSSGASAVDARAAGGLGAPAAQASRWTMRRAMSRTEMAAFIRELATALQAGLPLVPSLRTLARTGRSPAQRAMLAALIHDVEHGQSLADAMAAWGRPFGDLTINLTRAGDVSGRLPEVLAQTADLLDRDVKLRGSIKSATIYPAILATLVTGAIIVVVTVIVPNLLKDFAGGAAALPWQTRVVQGVAAFFGDYWWIIVPAVVLGIWGINRFYATPRGRLWCDERLLRVPLLGRLLRDVAVARFTRTLGTLTTAGLPVLTALRVTKGTLGNSAMERTIDGVIEEVAAGRTISELLDRSGQFPPMLVQIVNLGERSGRLDQLLTQAAGAFEDRTETSVKLLTTALPPLLVVLLAGVVGFVVLAIMLALLNFQDSVSAL